MWPINYSRKEEIKSSGQKCDAVRYYSHGLMKTTLAHIFRHIKRGHCSPAVGRHRSAPHISLCARPTHVTLNVVTSLSYSSFGRR